MSPVIASDWERSIRVFKDKPGFAQVFMPGGKAPAEGEVFRNPALAKTLRLIAEKGRDAYYKGPIAAAIVKFSQANGGFFSLEDFARHPPWDDPLDHARGRRWELPPPGQGPRRSSC
jgi:gamma-glutamyltranspeptidase/glutathione hydrolase